MNTRNKVPEGPIELALGAPSVSGRRIPNIGITQKGKGILLEVWTNLECFRSLRFPDFKRVGT